MSVSRFRFILAAVLGLATTSCGGGIAAIGASAAGAALPAARGQETLRQISAEVRDVDALQRRIQVTTEDGRTGTVRYDDATVVVRRQEHHPVTSLEPGDRVLIQARQDAQGQLTAARIDVHQPARTAAIEAVRIVAGSIASIDHDEGFLVVTTEAGAVRVTVPATSPQATLDYFRRLVPGAAVRLEAVPAADETLEIHRFL